MNQFHSKQQTEKLLQRNDEFHRLICEQAGNGMLIGMLEHIWRDIKRLRLNYLVTPAGHDDSTREHATLVDALESHNKELIRKTVQQHARRTMKGILETLELQDTH